MEISNVHTLTMRGASNELTMPSQDGCEVLRAISDALAILHAIDQGGLLDAMPEDPGDRARFQTAISLLDIMERQLRGAVGDPEHLNSDECRCGGRVHCAPRY